MYFSFWVFHIEKWQVGGGVVCVVEKMGQGVLEDIYLSKRQPLNSWSRDKSLRKVSLDVLLENIRIFEDKVIIKGVVKYKTCKKERGGNKNKFDRLRSR